MNISEIIHLIYKRFKRADLYYGHGTTNAWGEAFALVLQSLQLVQDRTALNEAKIKKKRLTILQINRINDLVDKRIQTRKPLPYLLNEAYFAGLSFYVDERVLIPRSPIAEFIKQKFNPWIQSKQVHHILDLCTGSACIAIACAMMFPEADVDATDISKEALEVADLNIKRYDLTRRINLIESDVFKNIKQKKYDIIVTNPPYISLEEFTHMPKEYTYEPEIALKAGAQGLDILERIILQAPKYLSKHGILISEAGDRSVIEKRFPNKPFVWLDLKQGEGDVFVLGR